MVSRMVGTIALGMFVVAGSTAYAGVDPGALCKEAKAKAAGKKAFDLLKAFGKNTKVPDDAKLADGVSKAQSKFTKGFTTAESKEGCLTSEDSDTIEAKVDTFVADVVARQEHFMDNDDGTITDNQTGLMWEKKDEVGGIHDVDKVYTWAGCIEGYNCNWPDYSYMCQPSAGAMVLCLLQSGGVAGCYYYPPPVNCIVDPYGFGADTTIWQWLYAVNTEGGTGFAGYSDWRLPSEAGCISCYVDGTCPCDPAELESILLGPYPCGIDPCIDPIFGPTASDFYWSGSTYSGYPYNAWSVSFGYGYVGSGYKCYADHVRAVRGGSPSGAFLDVTTGVLD